MIIKELLIEEFRSFKNVLIPLSKGVTLIAGQNGTGKSTILGMIGQPFRFDEKGELKDFFGLKAKSEFSDIFKFSPDKDIPGKHIYHLKVYDNTLHPDGDSIQVKSQKRSDTGTTPDPNKSWTFIRLVTGKKRSAGDGGNIEGVPVVYLGLSRLYPIGESITQPYSKDMDDPDKKNIIREHKDILRLNHIKAQNENLRSIASSIDKIHIGYENDSYDTYTNSAGQDNTSKVLAAMLYLKKIKAKMGDDYKGGFLLIDELDATLFPASQERLIEKLIDFAQKQRVQVIATTHSPNILKHVMDKYKGKETLAKIIYLRSLNNEGSIDINPTPTWEFIENNLNLTRSDLKIKIKVAAFREDDVAEKIIKRLLGTKLLTNVSFEKLDFGYPELKKLSVYKWPLFQNAMFFIDGEVPDEAMQKISHAVRLPGGQRPEECIYDTISVIDDNHDFWDASQGRTKQECFRNCPDKMGAKIWFQSLPSKDKTAFIKIWMDQNQKSITEFKAQFISLYNKQAQKVGAVMLKSD